MFEVHDSGAEFVLLVKTSFCVNSNVEALANRRRKEVCKNLLNYQSSFCISAYFHQMQVRRFGLVLLRTDSIKAILLKYMLKRVI